MDACKRILETHVIQVIISDVVKCVPYLVDLLLSSSLVHAGPKDPEPEDDEESGGLLEQLLVNCIVVCQTLEHVSCNVCVCLCVCVCPAWPSLSLSTCLSPSVFTWAGHPGCKGCKKLRKLLEPSLNACIPSCYIISMWIDKLKGTKGLRRRVLIK